jgi:hypothetical protein
MERSARPDGALGLREREQEAAWAGLQAEREGGRKFLFFFFLYGWVLLDLTVIVKFVPPKKVSCVRHCYGDNHVFIVFMYMLTVRFWDVVIVSVDFAIS